MFTAIGRSVCDQNATFSTASIILHDFFRKEPLTNYLPPYDFILKTEGCNATILTSSGTARGGYLDVRSAARHKQQAAEQL